METSQIETLTAEHYCFVLFKPDAYEHDIVSEITRRMAQLGYRLRGQRELMITETQILGIWPTFYTEDWWRATVNYLQRGKVSIALAIGDHVSVRLNQLKQELRVQYPGDHKVVTVIHTSDNCDELVRNVQTFWGDDELRQLIEENASCD